MNVNRWVDDKIAAMDAVGWRPNAARALARLREMERLRRRRRRAGFVAGSVAALAAGVALLLVSAPQACAEPNGCGDHARNAVFTKRTVSPEERIAPPVSKEPRVVLPPQAQAKEPKVIPAPPTPQLFAQAAKPEPLPRKFATPAPVSNFKEQGSPSATVTLEIYTDYECPSCAMLYREFMPKLVAEYVRTSKVKVLHRDFPLPQHPYAKLAARYANAAGRLGFYDAAVEQIFKTQEQWNGSGNVDAQLVAVFPPGVMQKVREMVKSDSTLDATVEADLSMVRSDQVNQTPSIVVVAKGRRQGLAGVPNWDLFKSYLDKLLEP
jgi:protein-disulfide isomerase